MIVPWAFLLISGWLAATLSGMAGFGGALLLLPVLTFTLGPKAAVPILTVAQLLGNLSRAAFGWREIHWRPALAFSAGALPASVLGSRVFVALSGAPIARWMGSILLAVVVLRHTALGSRKIPAAALPVAGAVVGWLSAIAGSAGPLGAAVFLSLQLPARAYVATEAVTAVLMHLTKSLTYSRYAALTRVELLQGLALGASLVLGSWTGRALLGRIPERGFAWLVEAMLIVSAVTLIVG
jgi:uncharacterized membrane protein YfcA